MSGSRGTTTSFRNRRRRLKVKHMLLRISTFLVSTLFAGLACGQVTAGLTKITFDQAIQLAIEHNHGLLAARTTIIQNQGLEVQANVRPNPTLFTDWEYLPLVPIAGGLGSYLRDSTEGDI